MAALNLKQCPLNTVITPVYFTGCASAPRDIDCFARLGNVIFSVKVVRDDINHMHISRISEARRKARSKLYKKM